MEQIQQTSRVVLASRRFQKDYLSFLRKYTDLEGNFREFLAWRQSHRPDESFGAKDGRMAGSKFSRCHLVHGKAVVIYQLYGSEIRLIAIDEHNAVEGGTNRQVLDYSRSLNAEDYYMFDVDQPVPAKTREPLMSEQSAYDAAPAANDAESMNHEPRVNGEASIEQPVNDVSPLWDDKVVRFLRNQNMLYVPRPSREMIAITLDRELIAEKGSVLLIDPRLPTIYHLSANELEAHFQPASRHTNHLGEAIAVAMTRPRAARQTVWEPDPVPTEVFTDVVEQTADTEVPTEPSIVEKAPTERVAEPVVERVAEPVMERKPAKPIMHKYRNRGIGAQIGRLLVTMLHLQQTKGSKQIDTMTLRENMIGRDARALSPVLSTAQNEGWVKKSGVKKSGPRAFYYCLTPIGEQKTRNLGDWPFTVANLKPPFSLGNAANVAEAHAG
jgi:hypothetical protein